ncbi:MAG TPA: histone family protein [Euryarchaeota archaeon]|nr:histone-like transcription factor (CBF/NF-Y) and archaeal histone [archaeon]HEQ78453.1 histone family protein [Euryarchaeota archaeon]
MIERFIFNQENKRFVTLKKEKGVIKMAELSIAACERIIRNATGLRVGKDAAELLAEILEDIGKDVARDAGDLAKHAKRKTVKAEDIKLAAK